MASSAAAAAAAASAATDGASERQPPPERSAGAAAPRARKRSRHTHDRQEVAHWWESDYDSGGRAPVELLNRLAVDDLDEDPYECEPNKDVSFDALPTAVKTRMLDGIRKLEPRIYKRTVRAEPGQGAVVVPREHTHDLMQVPEEAVRVCAGADDDDDDGDDGLGAVKAVLHAHLTALPSYEQAEVSFAQFSMQGDRSGALTVDAMVQELSSLHFHGVHGIDAAGQSVLIHGDRTGTASVSRPAASASAAAASAAAASEDGAPTGLTLEEDAITKAATLFVVFEVDDPGVFFCAVALRPVETVTATYHVRSPIAEKRLRALRGAYMGRVYFACPCV